MEVQVNGHRMTIHADENRLLLFVLRNDFALTGTKYGCGEGQCGACTVLLDGAPVRSRLQKSPSLPIEKFVLSES